MEYFKDVDFSKRDMFELEKLFNKFKEITFRNCTFNHKFELKKDIKLKFSHCSFEDEWKHIVCEKIVYDKCEFDKFTYFNIGKIKDISKDSTLFNCTFNSINCEGIIFKKPFIHIVDENKLKHINDIKLVRCEFEDDFILKVTDKNDERKLHEIKLDSIDLSHSIFHKKFKMQNCIVNNVAKFYNTSFMDLADFYQTEFNEVDFERTSFEKISVFSEVVFKQNIDFKYTKFIGKLIFRDTVIKGKLNLRNTIFDDEASFLDVTSISRKNKNGEFIGDPKIIDVANRETARIIKNFFDKSNNIIEANKFYALEMKQRKIQLDTKSSFEEWIVFFLHGESSNHSQSWYDALLWIFMLGFLYTVEVSGLPLMTLFITLIVIYTMIIYFLKKYKLFIKYFNIFFSIFSLILTGYVNYGTVFNIFSIDILNEIVKNINPLANLNNETMTLGIFIYKVVISYLIYQFIVSVRQNTRRK